MDCIYKELDNLLSKIVRNRAKLKDGSVKCFTCNKVRPYTEMEAGHYVKRSHMNTRYNIKNVQAQCIECNRFKNGNLKVYKEKIDLIYGKGTSEELERDGRKIRKYIKEELKELKTWMKQQLN